MESQELHHQKYSHLLPDTNLEHFPPLMGARKEHARDSMTNSLREIISEQTNLKNLASNLWCQYHRDLTFPSMQNHSWVSTARHGWILMQRKRVSSKPREFRGLVTPWTDLSYTQGEVRRNRKEEDRGRVEGGGGGRKEERRQGECACSGLWDGSADKDAYLPSLVTWIWSQSPHKVRGEMFPQSCPLASIHTLWHMYPSMH